MTTVGVRAYTHIDRGRAAVGNRWLERSWSTFLGNTVSLIQKDGPFEWMAGQSGEFRVALDEALLEILDFGDIEWSEEANSHGASLLCRRRHARYELSVRTFAYHDLPAMVRTVNVTNLGTGYASIDHVLSERLPIRHSDVRVYTSDFSSGNGPTVWETHHHAAAIALDDRGMFVGQMNGGLFFLFAPDARECAVAATGPTKLAPGETWRTPPSFLVPFVGLTRDAASTVYAQFVQRFLDHRESGAPWE